MAILEMNNMKNWCKMSGRYVLLWAIILGLRVFRVNFYTKILYQ